ncbi:MAG: PilZ domain-containing protein [Treponema sp.]|nr:PilZ domain-containing protein [Treponema sp.]
MLYDESIPVIYLKDRVEYLLSLTKPAGNELLFQANQRIEGIKAKDQLDLMVNYRGKIITFTAAVLHIKDMEVTCAAPDLLYKDLDRSYSRVDVPSEMQVQFAFLGEMYNLSFPKVMEYETDDDDGNKDDFLQNRNLKNLSGLIDQMGVWFKKNADAYKLVFFKNTKPSGIEERVLAETGKALFLPSTGGNFPERDPFPHTKLITGDIFKHYLESTGVGLAFVDSACARFIKAKEDNKIFADAWVPILFHEYVIGYIHVWNETGGKPPFDFSLLDTLYQFAKVLSYSLKINGYFDKGKMKNDGFEGKIIDISASGLLFAYPSSDISAALRSEKKLAVTIVTPQRSITLEASIVRRFKDSALGYYGCQFEKVTEEDMNYLIEYIYGVPFSTANSVFLAGKV